MPVLMRLETVICFSLKYAVGSEQVTRAAQEQSEGS